MASFLEEGYGIGVCVLRHLPGSRRLDTKIVLLLLELLLLVVRLLLLLLVVRCDIRLLLLHRLNQSVSLRDSLFAPSF